MPFRLPYSQWDYVMITMNSRKNKLEFIAVNLTLSVCGFVKPEFSHFFFLFTFLLFLDWVIALKFHTLRHLVKIKKKSNHLGLMSIHCFLTRSFSFSISFSFYLWSFLIFFLFFPFFYGFSSCQNVCFVYIVEHAVTILVFFSNDLELCSVFPRLHNSLRFILFFFPFLLWEANTRSTCKQRIYK